MALKFWRSRESRRYLLDRCALLEESNKNLSRAIVSAYEKRAEMRTQRDLEMLKNEHLHSIALEYDAQIDELKEQVRVLKSNATKSYCSAQSAMAVCMNSDGFARVSAPVRDRILNCIRSAYSAAAVGAGEAQTK